MQRTARLAHEYRDTPTRFRERDRSALIAYVIAFAVYREAARTLLDEGLVVDGRSSPDRARKHKSPVLTVWTQAKTQLRFWARELGLTPDARIRQGITDDSNAERDEEADVVGF